MRCLSCVVCRVACVSRVLCVVYVCAVYGIHICQLLSLAAWVVSPSGRAWLTAYHTYTAHTACPIPYTHLHTPQTPHKHTLHHTHTAHSTEHLLRETHLADQPTHTQLRQNALFVGAQCTNNLILYDFASLSFLPSKQLGTQTRCRGVAAATVGA